MEEIIKSIGYTALGGILGYFSRLFIEHRLEIDRIKKSIQITEFSKAAANFRAAFAPALSFIYLAKKHGSTHEVPNVDKFLRDSILPQAAVIEVFRIFVPEGNRTAYQEAWEKYRYEVWNYGFDANSLRQDIDDPYVIYENLIHSILQFAKDK